MIKIILKLKVLYYIFFNIELIVFFMLSISKASFQIFYDLSIYFFFTC